MNEQFEPKRGQLPPDVVLTPAAGSSETMGELARRLSARGLSSLPAYQIHDLVGLVLGGLDDLSQGGGKKILATFPDGEVSRAITVEGEGGRVTLSVDLPDTNRALHGKPVIILHESADRPGKSELTLARFQGSACHAEGINGAFRLLSASCAIDEVITLRSRDARAPGGPLYAGEAVSGTQDGLRAKFELRNGSDLVVLVEVQSRDMEAQLTVPGRLDTSGVTITAGSQIALMVVRSDGTRIDFGETLGQDILTLTRNLLIGDVYELTASSRVFPLRHLPGGRLPEGARIVVVPFMSEPS